MKKQIVMIFVLMVIIGGCVATDTSNTIQDVIQTSQNIVEPRIDPSTVPDKITFIDSSVFDKSISKAMKVKHPNVTIAFEQDFSLNNIPDRIDKWLYMVHEYHGTVVKKPVPTRGLLEEAIIYIITGIYNVIKKNMMYGPAKDYNATIYYYPEDDIIHEVVFEHKTGA